MVEVYFEERFDCLDQHNKMLLDVEGVVDEQEPLLEVYVHVVQFFFEQQQVLQLVLHRQPDVVGLLVEDKQFYGHVVVLVHHQFRRHIDPIVIFKRNEIYTFEKYIFTFVSGISLLFDR